MSDLEMIYRETLVRCDPQLLVRDVVRPTMPRDVVAIGKCAGGLLDGVVPVHDVRDAIAIVPRGYPSPRSRPRTAVHFGGHPYVDDSSFEAGGALLEFVDAHDDVLFLVSGGGSACAETPLAPWFSRDDVMQANRALVDAGLPIEQINCARKHLSAIKGGRLAARVRGTTVTLVYSDVATGDLAAVASGPTLPDTSTRADAIAILERTGRCERLVATLRAAATPPPVRRLDRASSHLVADNGTLTRTAAAIAPMYALRPVVWDGQIEGGVEEAARAIALRASQLQPGEILVAGGEPVVARHGDGRGGRCSEMAVRFALASRDAGLEALFGSSDGVDGSSGAAGVVLSPVPTAVDESAAAADLGRSDSMSAALRLGRAVIMPPTGNNLRDLYLVARH